MVEQVGDAADTGLGQALGPLPTQTFDLANVDRG
jgi:hypothetical protein